MSLDLGELHATIDADDKAFSRALDKAKRDFDGLDKGIEAKVADIADTMAEGGDEAGEGFEKGVWKGLSAAELRLKGFQVGADGRLRTLAGRFASEGEKAGLALGDGLDKGSRRGIGAFGRGLDVVKEKAAHFGKAMNVAGTVGLVASVGSLIPAVLSLGAALLPAAGALLALPAAAAGAKIAMLTLQLALQGVGDALSASLTGDAAAFEKALEKLTPTARGVVRDIGGAFFGLQKTAQSAFFAPMKKTAAAFGQNLKGPLKTGIGTVATALGGLGSHVLAFASGSQSVSVVKDLFAGVGAAIDGAKDGVAPLLTGIRDLIAVFIPGMDNAGKGIGEAMTKWGEWMSSISSSGKALGWFDTAKTVFKQLWDIGKNVFDMIVGIFNANGDGGGALGTIEKITAAMAEWVNSAEGQEMLAGVFSLLADVGTNLATILPVVATILGGIATVMNSLPGPVKGVVTGLLALAAAWKILGITSLINGAKMAAAWVLGLGPIGWIIIAVVALVALIIMYWDEIVAFLEDAWNWIKETAISVWTAIVDFLDMCWQGIVDGVTAAWDFIVGLIQGYFDLVYLIVSTVFTAIVDFFVFAWESIVAGVEFAWNFVVELIRGYINMVYIIVYTVITTVVAYLEYAWSFIKETASSVWQAIVDFLTTIWESIKSAIQAGVDKVMEIIGFLKQIPTRVREFFQKARDGAVAKLKSLIEWAKGVPGKVLSALGNVGSKLLQAGKDLINGLLNGLKSAWGTVKSWILGALKGMEKAVKNFFGIASPSKMFMFFGRMLPLGMADGVRAGLPVLEKATQALNDAVALPEADMALSATASNLSKTTTHLSEADRNLLRRATEGPNEFTGTIPVNFGEGINQSVQVKMQRNNRQLVRSARAGSGAGL